MSQWEVWAGLFVTVFLAGPVVAQENTTRVVPTGMVLEQVLVRVNGDIITQTELELRQIDAMRERNLQLTTDNALRSALFEVTPEVISAMVDEVLIVQRGHELGYHLSDEQFSDLIDGIMEENNFETEEEFRAALRDQNGMDADDLRRMMERQMLLNQVQQIEILSKVTMTQTEAREYYDEHLDEFTNSANVTMREILIRVPEGVSGQLNVFADDSAKLEAEEARQRILEGEDFDLVAVAVSDAPSKVNGGLIGPLDIGFVNETVMEALDGMEAGEITAPIRTTAGYQVFELVELTDPEPRPFEEVRDTIGNSVFSDRRLDEYSRYLDRLRSEADIEWRDEQLKEAFDSYKDERAQRLTASERE